MPTNRSTIGHHARNAVSEMQLEARAIRDTAQQRAGEFKETARHRATDLKQQMEEHITHNPLKAVLAAAGLGMVLGFLWRR